MASRSPVFRVETYEISSTEFTGTTYRLYLRHTLSTHYFPMVMWGVAANTTYNASDLLVRVSADPYGTGDLSVAEGNYLELTRATAVTNCAMKVVVVECLRDEGGAGFQLLDVQATSLAASAGTGVQSTTDTSGTAWPDASRVVLFGGYRGGGLSGSATGAQYPTGGTRIYPSGTATINVDRYAAGASDLAAATCVTYVVQWGIEWLVQRNNVSGTNTGATLASTSHYSTSALTYSVLRANTWVWSCGYTNANTPGACFLGQVATLGDGVTQLTTESTTAVGGMATVTTRSVEVYTLTHQQLVAEYDFRPSTDGSGADTVTVAAAVVADTYRTASGLYGVSTKGERFALCWAGVTSTTAADISEVQVHARPTASTTVTLTPADTSPSLSWAGWIETVDFGSIDTPAGKLPVFRVTSYRIPSGVFTGTTYTLSLLSTLASNYFVLIQGATAAASTQDTDDVNVRVTSDPAGTDDLEATGSNGLILTRAASGANWVGTVTVVECLRSSDQHGFRLLAVKDVSLASTSSDRQITETTLSGVTYTNLDHVQVLTGYRGAGVTTDGSGTTSGHSAAGAVYGRPYGTNGVRLHRRCSATMVAVTACVYVIEWGSAWTLKRQAVEAVAGGADINATSEFSAPSLSGSVTAARSALFATAVSEGANANQNYAGIAAALGDGVTVGTTPSTVAVGAWSSTPSPYEVLAEVLTHPDLAVDQTNQATSSGTTADLGVDGPLASEHYGTYNSVTYTCGRRMALAHTACSLASDAIAAAVVQTRHTAKTTQTWLRDRADSSSIAGWFQSIDLGGIYADAEAIQVDNDIDDLDLPVAYLIMQDPAWEGGGNVVSATSEAGTVLGLVEAATSNQGSAYPYQEGEPTSTTELTLRTQGGAVGCAGGWAYRTTTETASTDWKAMNALIIPFKSRSVTTADKLYAQGLVYSTVYDRVVWAWIDPGSATTIQVRYISSSNLLGTATSATVTVVDADSNRKTSGLAMCETPDGALLMVFQTYNSLTGLEIDLYRSTDGGATWTQVIRKVGQRIGVYSGSDGQHVMASSGDYVRLLYVVSTASPSGLTTVHDKVSADRGMSWETVGTLSPYTWTAGNAAFVGSTPFDVVGLGDVAGTFLLQMVTSVGGTTVKTYIATGKGTFSNVSGLDWDVSSGFATSPKVKGLWWCRMPDHILQFAWIEGSDASEIVIRRCDISDVTNAANWNQIGRISGFSGVLNYGPHRPRAVWAGSQIVISGGVQDPDTAAAGDALVAGHWSFALGGWDTLPAAPSTADTISEFYWYASATNSNLLTYQWSACLGEPNSDALTPWTRSTFGVSTKTWTSSSLNITTSSSTAYYYYSLTFAPASNSAAWGYAGGRGFTFMFRLKASNQRSTSVEDIGIRIEAPTTSSVTTTGYSVTFRTCTTQLVVYDNVASSALATISTTDFASEVEFRASIFGTSLWIKWRLASAGPTAAWTTYGAYTLTSGTITGQLIKMGIIAAAGAAGTSTIDLYEVQISKSGSDLGQRGDISKPTDLYGALMTREPMLVANGMWVGWSGGGGADGDTFTAQLMYQRGTALLSLPSPSAYWESTSLVQNAIVLQADPDSASGARWQVEALALLGTTDRTCTVEFSDTDSWTSPAESIELDATLWEDLTVVDVDGAAVCLEAASGEVFAPWRGELLGAYIRFTAAGSATGKTYAIHADQFSDDGWVSVRDGVDLASAGVTIGAKACLYADRMVMLAAVRFRYRYMRLVFPDVSSVSGSLGTATGTHRLGAMVPGHYLEFNRKDGPLQLEITDTEETATTTARSKSGVEYLVQDGEPARTLSMTVSQVSPEAPTSSRGAVGKMIRDLSRVAHAGYTRPVVLVKDSTWRARDTVVYGVLNREGATMNEGYHYKPDDGSRRFFVVGEMALRLDEEV